jgi:hypothetical protein
MKSPSKQSVAVLAFLSEVLACEEIAVPALEAQARAAGLLGKQQAITNSKALDAQNENSAPGRGGLVLAPMVSGSGDW